MSNITEFMRASQAFRQSVFPAIIEFDGSTYSGTVSSVIRGSDLEAGGPQVTRRVAIMFADATFEGVRAPDYRSQLRVVSPSAHAGVYRVDEIIRPPGGGETALRCTQLPR